MIGSQEVLGFNLAEAISNLSHSFCEHILIPLTLRIDLQQLTELPLVDTPVDLDAVQLRRPRRHPVQDEVLFQVLFGSMNVGSVGCVIVQNQVHLLVSDFCNFFLQVFQVNQAVNPVSGVSEDLQTRSW